MLLVGSPTQPGVPNLGAWGHFLWVLVIVCLIIFVIWWAWSQVAARLPEPMRTVLFVIGIVLVTLIVIYYVLVPLMGVF